MNTIRVERSNKYCMSVVLLRAFGLGNVINLRRGRLVYLNSRVQLYPSRFPPGPDEYALNYLAALKARPPAVWRKLPPMISIPDRHARHDQPTANSSDPPPGEATL